MLVKNSRRIAACSISVLILAVRTHAAPIYDNGPRDRVGGSEMTHWIQADDFTLPTGGRVESAQFWDFEDTATFQNSIVWQIYANSDDNTPGVVLYSGNSANLSHLATGQESPDYAEYVTTFDIVPVSLPAGTYWFAFHNGPLSYNSNLGRVYLQRTMEGDAIPAQGRVAPFTDPWFSHVFPGFSSEFAFLLNGVPGSRVTAVTAENGLPHISFTTVAGQNYRVEYKNDFSDVTWAVVRGADNVPGTGAAVQVSDADAGNKTHRFYRVTLQ